MACEGAEAMTCNICGMFIFLTESKSNSICSKGKVVAFLKEKIQGFEAYVHLPLYKGKKKINGQNAWNTKGLQDEAKLSQKMGKHPIQKEGD